MDIIDKKTITDHIVKDIELLIMCTNTDVSKFCDNEGWDILKFINKIDESRFKNNTRVG